VTQVVSDLESGKLEAHPDLYSLESWKSLQAMLAFTSDNEPEAKRIAGELGDKIDPKIFKYYGVNFSEFKKATTVLPAGGLTRSFQQGNDSGFGDYQSTRHLRIMANNPKANEAKGRVATDGKSKGRVLLQSLLQFDGIFGNEPGRIPLGSQIHAATLELHVSNKGNIPKFHQMATAWDAKKLTYDNAKLNGNTRPGIQVDDSEALVAPVAEPFHGNTGLVKIDVTARVRQWSKGAGNFGWVLLPRGSDAWAADGRDAAPEKRPKLRIEYIPK
jgi:hypothetical protein